MTLDIRSLVGASRRDLAALAAARGTPVDPAALVGFRYDGISLGLPRIVERLTWTKFGKAFARDPASGGVRGWNLRVEQDSLDQPWTPRRARDGRAHTFGHFVVDIAAAGRVELDYGRGGNRRGDPIGLLRDPLVALAPDILLGWSYLAVGSIAIPTPSWFVLRRGAELDPITFVAAPARRGLPPPAASPPPPSSPPAR